MNRRRPRGGDVLPRMRSKNSDPPESPETSETSPPLERVEITGLAHGGSGLGRIQGKVIFVPLSVPGDVVLVERVPGKKAYDWGRLHRILEDSPDRRSTPPCPLFGDCGGCSSQHIRDEAQPRLKEALFRNMLEHRCGTDPARVRPVVPSPLPFEYRTNLTLKVKGGRAGFFALRSHHLVPVNRCMLALPPINWVLEHLDGEVATLKAARVSEMRLATSPSDPRVQVSVKTEGTVEKGALRRLTSCFQSVPEVISLTVEGTRRRLVFPEDPSQALLSFPLPSSGIPRRENHTTALGPDVFLQANHQVNLLMIQELLAFLAGLGSGLDILELYAGAGNFTIPMGLAGHRVTACELHRLAVENAARNLAEFGLDSCSVHPVGAARFLERELAESKVRDVLLADPPRSGMKKEAALIAALRTPYVLLVSCEPAMLCRDLGVLFEAGYVLEWSLPLDQFPQTYHLESLNVLRLSKTHGR